MTASSGASAGLLIRGAILTLLMPIVCCAYFNTFYNARESYMEAVEMARENPDNPSSLEALLLEDAITGAAKVLARYPDSRWADDAQLLMGDALLLSGRRTLTGSGTSDFNEAMLAYSSTVVMTGDAVLRDRAHIGMGRAAMELGRFNDAAASFESVSGEDDYLFGLSRLNLMGALIQGSDPEAALTIARSMELPRDDSLAAEFRLMEARALMETGMPDSGAVLALAAGDCFGRGEGYCRSLTVAAEAYINADMPEEAVRVLSSLLLGYRSNLEMAQIALLEGKAREIAGDISGASSSYRSSADRDTYREYGAEALYRRALLLERQDRLEEALQELNELSSRSGGYVWIRLAEGRLRDLALLNGYIDLLEEEEDTWLLRLMAAEKRMDLYGSADAEALEELEEIASLAPDMERAMALSRLAALEGVSPDSSRALMLAALGLSSGGDLATLLEDSLGLPHGDDYGLRPSIVLEKAGELVDENLFQEAHSMLAQALENRWSESIRPELLWAAYEAAEGARLEDSILESYLNELSTDYPDTRFGSAATGRLGGSEDTGEE